MSGFLPDAEGDLTGWMSNYYDKIPAVGAACGMSAAEIKAQQNFAQALIKEIANWSKAQADARKATATKKAQREASILGVRAAVAHLKANPHWTDAMSKDLQTGNSIPAVDQANYKPKLVGKVSGGAVQLRFYKLGVQAINVYVKMPGDAEFTLLQTVGRSVFTDSRPLKTPGVAEVRQYRIMGVMADKEIGLPSDIVTISFGG